MEPQGSGGHLSTRSARLAWSTALLALGQTILLALGSRTRASGTFVTTDGPALLAPDSVTYLESAASITSVLATPWTRVAYPGLLLAVDRAGIPLGAVVVLQCMALVLAGALLHALAEEATGSALAGVAAAATLLVNPLTAQWARFILTESLTLVLVVVAVWASTRLLEGHEPPRRYATMALTAGALAGLLRPNGILVLGAAAAVVTGAANATRSRRSRVVRLSAVWIGTLLFLGAAAGVTGQPGEASIAAQLYDGVVIEGTEEVRLTLTMPSAHDGADDTVGSAVRFAADYPVATFRLVLTRAAVEVAQVRPHYPRAVNIAIAAAMVAFVLMLLLGLTDRRSRAVRHAGLMVALPMLALIGLTFAVPEGRYGWSAMIALAPLVGIGVNRTHSALVAPGTPRGRRSQRE